MVMNNQSGLKWHQKTNGVIVLLLLFFPLGLYHMWKNNLWSKGLRWMITATFAVIMVSSIGSSNPERNGAKEAEGKNVISIETAERFIQVECQVSEQKLLKKKIATVNGQRIYMFLIEAGEFYRISSVSETGEKLGGVIRSPEVAMEEWDAVK